MEKKLIKDAIHQTSSISEAAKLLGVSRSTLTSYANKYCIELKRNKGGKGVSKKRKIGKFKLEDILSGKHPSYKTYHLKNRLIEEGIKSNKCEECGISEWNGKPINCQLDHINGNSTDHSLSNLRILCPNCHSQTDTFCGKNKNTKPKTLENLSNKRNIKLENDIKNKKVVDKVLNSNIDFSKIGWVKEASKVIGITPQKVSGWMRRNMSDFYETKCFKRKFRR